MYPSPGTAQNVWALPQTSCSMVADAENHNNYERETNHRCSNELEYTKQYEKTIFDVVKSG